VHLLERRLCELAPSHPLPVTEAHLGTPVATVSHALVGAALGAGAPGGAGGPVSAAPSAQR
jgi:hypothetical protein